KAGDAGNAADVLAFGGAGFESGEEGFGDFLVGGLGEEKSDVDVDSVFEQSADSGNAFLGARDLDHHVFAADGFPEAAGFFNGFVGLEGEVRGDFQAHVAVFAVCGFVDGAEDVGGVLNVADGDFFINAFGVERGVGFVVEDVVVVVAAGDGFFEDGRVGG